MRLPATRTVQPGKAHWGIFRSLIGQFGAAANITTDAHLAALAIENGVTLYSADNDFGRFETLRRKNPLL